MSIIKNITVPVTISTHGVSYNGGPVRYSFRVQLFGLHEVASSYPKTFKTESAAIRAGHKAAMEFARREREFAAKGV
jgi:hypothetical protein